MAIKRTVLFAAIGLVASTLAADAQDTTGAAPGRPADATTIMRALLADPDFVSVPEVAENAYDFAAPDGVPGFGPLDAADGERRLAHLIWE